MQRLFRLLHAQRSSTWVRPFQLYLAKFPNFLNDCEALAKLEAPSNALEKAGDTRRAMEANSRSSFQKPVHTSDSCGDSVKIGGAYAHVG